MPTGRESNTPFGSPMTRVLLDTDIFSEVLKGHDKNVAEKARSYFSEHRMYTISAVTIMEVVKGMHKKRQAKKLAELMVSLDRLEILFLDEVAAIHAGRIYADLESTGLPIGRADPMIAGIAISRGLPLITGNTKHFQRIADLDYDLKLENWRND